MGWLDALFDRIPIIALFLSLALGYALGKVRVGPISLGGVCGTLIVAIALGQFGVTLADDAKNIAFATFIFALGFTAGPQFFANLDRNGLKLGTFTLIEVVLAVGLVLLATAILGLDRGTAAGLLAGSATESAVVGTSTDAIGRLDLPPDQIKALQANVATAYTVSYLFGLVTIVLLTSQFSGYLLRVDLREEAQRLWERLGGGGALGPGQSAATPRIVGRVYEVSRGSGRSVTDVERELGGAATVERVRRGAAVIDVTPDLTLSTGDLVLLVGRRTSVVDAVDVLGEERADTQDMDMALTSQDVFVTNREVNGLTVDEVRARADGGTTRGVYFTGLSRAEQALPALPGTTLRSGDVVTLTGAPGDIERAGAALGRVVPRSNVTDFVYLGTGVALGMLVGLATVEVGGVPLALGTGGGALLTGLVFGWYHSRHPTFGNYPPAAAQFAKDLGLATFIAATGLSVGPQAGELIGRYGLALPIAGILVVLVPATVSLLVGRYLLHIEAPILVGAVAGQQCSTPAISAVTEKVGNTTPMIGYTVTYALSNVVLPLTGPLVVALAGTV